MRIVGGVFKSRKLRTLPGDTTRPSSDRLKEALFNIVGPYFQSGSFLDVFAGSGAVGLEAISRGMDKVTFIELDKEAQRVILSNVKDLGVQSQTKLLRSDVLKLVANFEEKFDLIFMDPPYDYPHKEAVILGLEKNLQAGGIMIVETHKDTTLDESIGNLKKTRIKKYGIAIIHIYEKL